MQKAMDWINGGRSVLIILTAIVGFVFWFGSTTAQISTSLKHIEISTAEIKQEIKAAAEERKNMYLKLAMLEATIGDGKQ